MNIVKWHPGKDVINLRTELDKVFGDLFGLSTDSTFDSWAPAVDIAENENEFIVKAEIPGLKQEDIKVTLKNDALTISGEKQQEKEDKHKNYHRIERSYGSFNRSFYLPSKVVEEKIKATYKNGLLEIVIPKSEETKPKEIAIDVK